MKVFRTILSFELKSFFTNKIFVGVTAFLMVALAVILFFPRFTQSEEEQIPTEDLPVMLLVSYEDDQELEQMLLESFAGAFTGYEVRLYDSAKDVEALVRSGEVECALVLDSLTSYTYHVDDLSMHDSNTVVADEVLQSIFRIYAMVQNGISAEDAGAIMSVQIQHEIQKTGKDQMQNYFYTYIMIMALYMVITLYGQMIATNVATEKSSRAMELLVTSAKPVSMMFGKVIASCIAGLTQLILVFGTAFACFAVNREFWDPDSIVTALFDIPAGLFGYMLIYFVLGFFVYAFLFGAVGSMASKLEDINTSSMPIMLMLVGGFMVVIFALVDNDMDSLLIRVFSFVPFTSSMAMFTRIAMSTVPIHEVVISIVILIASAVGIGAISAKIYRMGVLLYGTPPKFSSILKALRHRS